MYPHRPSALAQGPSDLAKTCVSSVPWASRDAVSNGRQSSGPPCQEPYEVLERHVKNARVTCKLTPWDAHQVSTRTRSYRPSSDSSAVPDTPVPALTTSPRPAGWAAAASTPPSAT